MRNTYDIREKISKIMFSLKYMKYLKQREGVECFHM